MNIKEEIGNVEDVFRRGGKIYIRTKDGVTHVSNCDREQYKKIEQMFFDDLSKRFRSRKGISDLDKEFRKSEKGPSNRDKCKDFIVANPELTDKVIAEKFGYSYKTVSSIKSGLRKEGKLQKRKYELSMDQKLIISLFGKCTVRELAKKFNVEFKSMKSEIAKLRRNGFLCTR